MSKVEISLASYPYFAKGDGVHDDATAIQLAIDNAHKYHVAQIIVPKGNYLLGKTLHLYGSDLSILGEDGCTFNINHNYTGDPTTNGTGVIISPTFDPTYYYPSAPITGNTITFNTAVPFSAGELLFLTNGRGSMTQIEALLGGTLTGGGLFNEFAPCEYVEVVSVTQSGSQSIVQLRETVIGVDEYSNIATTTSNENFLHVRRITLPCEKITFENIDFTFTDMSADASLYTTYARNVTLRNIRMTNPPTVVGARGAFWSVGSTNVLYENIASPTSICFNSSRQCTVRRCNISGVSFEEGCTDNFIVHNTFRCTGGLGVRFNDNPCRRNHVDGNVILGGTTNYGAIGVWEGVQNIISNNIMCQGTANSAWTGGHGNTFIGNIGDSFGRYNPNNLSIGNSWDGVVATGSTTINLTDNHVEYMSRRIKKV